MAVALLVTQPMGAEDPAACALLKDYLESWSTGEVAAIDGLLSPDFTRHAGPLESAESLDELRHLMRALHEYYDEPRFDVEATITAVEGCAFRGEFQGFHRSANKAVKFPVTGMVRVVNGKIAEEWLLGGRLRTMLAFGYLLAPDGFEAHPPMSDGLVTEGEEGEVSIERENGE